MDYDGYPTYRMGHGVRTLILTMLSPNLLLSLAHLWLTLYNFEDVAKGFMIAHNPAPSSIALLRCALVSVHLFCLVHIVELWSDIVKQTCPGSLLRATHLSR
jgi:hypothetical protein